MAQIGNFDATQVEPASRPAPLPNGWYNVTMTDSEMKPTKANDGHYLLITLKVISGFYAGRLAFARLNLFNKNPVAVEIAQKELSAICHATGVMQVQETSVLHNRPFQARIVISPAKDGYDEGNDVKGYAKSGTHPSVEVEVKQPGASGVAPGSGMAPPPAFLAGQPAPPATPPAFTPPAAPPAPVPAAPAPVFTPPTPTPSAPTPAPAPPAPAPAGNPAADMTPPWLK